MKSFLLRIFSVGLSASLLFAGTANASIELMQVGSIKGSSTMKGWENWINVNSFSWGVSSVVANGGGGVSVGKPVFSDFSWTQSVDQSAPALFSAISKGAVIPTITFDVLNTGVGQPTKFFEMSFTNAFMTSLNYSGSSGGGINLDGSFAYQAVKMTYWPIDPKGKVGIPVSASYDLLTAKGSVSNLLAVYSAGLSGSVSAVPEPETYGMMAAGLGLMGFMVRRKKSA